MVLETVDYAVMGLYMLALVGIGLHYRGFAQKSLENYFLGGRRLKGWMSGTSYAVTCMNADVAPSYCGMTVITGVFVCWWYLSRFGLALMIGGLLFAVFWHRLRLFTAPEFYELRFSGGPALAMRTWTALRSAFIAVVAWTGAGLLGLSKVTEGVLGWSRWETWALVLPVIALYVLLSGYVGVVVSDLLQTVVMVVSSLVLMGMVWADFGGPSGLHTALVAELGPGVVSWHPPRHHELLGVLGVVAWAVGTAVGYGGDAAPMSGAMEGQRILSCRDGREASLMYVWAQGVLFLMLAVLTLPALGAMVRWPGLHTGAIDKELAYGMLLAHYLPAGVLGLALVALFASIMSTVDSNMNFGAQVFINDVYRRLVRPGASLKSCMRVGRVVMLAILGLALAVATQARNVIDIAVFMLGLSSAELTANWGQWWWWRFNGPARLAASLGGPVIFLVNQLVVFEHLIDVGEGTPYVVVLASMAGTCVLWVVVALATPPEPETRLVEFYRQARPLGWWGPIAARAGGEAGRARPILTGLALAALGATALGSAVVVLSNAYVGSWAVASLAAMAAGTTGLIFGATYRRFLAVLEQGYEGGKGAASSLY